VDQGSWSVPLTARVGAAALRDWSVIGAWPAAAGLDERLPPDAAQAQDPAADYEGRRWTAISAPSGRVDLAARFPQDARGVSYAYSQVFVPADTDANLELSSDGGILAKVNGEAVYARATGASGTERVPIRLKMGWNTLLLKLARRGEAWGFTAEVTDREGDTPTGLGSRADFAK
jgi:hypothetical protein